MTRFARLLPDEAVVVEATPAMWETGLFPEEASYVAAAVEKRRREFTAGRNCAREALRMLGFDACSIGVGLSRAPVFPRGISGSITHAIEYCAAAVIRRREVLSIGIDAEPNEPLEAGLCEMVCTIEERSRLSRLPAAYFGNWSKLLFSAKESFYKAWFQLHPVYLDFLEASIEIDSEQRTFAVKVTKAELDHVFRAVRFQGRYAWDRQLICTAVTASRLSAPVAS